MQLRDLEYAVKVAETASFIAASKACNVSQPALSIQIKKLEDELGIQLFEREKKRFIVTEAGKEIIAKAKELLTVRDQMKELAKIHKDPSTGKLKLGAFPTLAPYYLPKVIPKFSKLFPKIEFLLVEEKTAPLLEMLEKGELDAAFIALPVVQKNLESIAIFKDPFLLALPAGHRLAAKERIHKSDIRDEKILLLEEGHCLSSQTLEYCEMSGHRELHDFRATSMETLREMVAQGMGITLMPETAAIPRKNIVYIKFTPPAPNRVIGLVFRKSHPRKALLTQLADAIRLK